MHFLISVLAVLTSLSFSMDKECADLLDRIERRVNPYNHQLFREPMEQFFKTGVFNNQHSARAWVLSQIDKQIEFEFQAGGLPEWHHSDIFRAAIHFGTVKNSVLENTAITAVRLTPVMGYHWMRLIQDAEMAIVRPGSDRLLTPDPFIDGRLDWGPLRAAEAMTPDQREGLLIAFYVEKEMQVSLLKHFGWLESAAKRITERWAEQGRLIIQERNRLLAEATAGVHNHPDSSALRYAAKLLNYGTQKILPPIPGDLAVDQDVSVLVRFANGIDRLIFGDK